MTDPSDVLIVGGGIVGLATAYRLLERRPELRLVVIEKEPALAMHQTGRNSGVIHSPNTYAPGSLKARLCLEGKRDAIAFAEAHGIPYELCGEIIVALTPEELPRLAAIHERAVANGVEGIRELASEEIRELEPHAAGIRGLHVPSTGIIDWQRFALALGEEIRARGGLIRTSAKVTAIARRADELVVETTAGACRARNLISCAGLWSDRVAAMTDDAGNERIVPFRGDYFVLRPASRDLCRTLIYPVPDPRFPFLGVHFTRRIDGEVWAGPNAVLAFAREGYRRRDISPRDLAGTVAYPGSLRLAMRYARMGLGEMWRDWYKGAFVGALRRYIPEIRSADLTWGPSGIRAQGLARDGRLVEDFSIGGSQRILHVRNAPSPAATASLAIGREISEMALGRFENA